jgi:hypothetical protein
MMGEVPSLTTTARWNSISALFVLTFAPRRTGARKLMDLPAVVLLISAST